MGLGKNIIKLDQFLKTWNIINKGCVDYKNMFNEFENIKNYDKEIIKKKKDELISLSYNNLLKIRKILEN
jgi:ribosome-associated protein YbcJ (S4-like RNA binding protein)